MGTLVLGYNKDFQYKSNLGKKNNQKFSHFAFNKFKEKLENKCQIHELNLIIQEESYTSKSSFLDNDILPVYQSKDAMWCMNLREGELKEDYMKHKQENILTLMSMQQQILFEKCKHEFNFERLCSGFRLPRVKSNYKTKYIRIK